MVSAASSGGRRRSGRHALGRGALGCLTEELDREARRAPGRNRSRRHDRPLPRLRAGQRSGERGRAKEEELEADAARARELAGQQREAGQRGDRGRG